MVFLMEPRRLRRIPLFVVVMDKRIQKMRVGAHDLPPQMRGSACKGSKRFTLGFVWSGEEGVAANLELGGGSESLAPLSWLEGAARSHTTRLLKPKLKMRLPNCFGRLWPLFSQDHGNPRRLIHLIRVQAQCKEMKKKKNPQKFSLIHSD